MAILWSDDFESGNALTVSYGEILDAQTNATCGRSGSWGVQGTGTDSQIYYSTFEKSGLTASTTFKVSWWLNFTKADFSTAGNGGNLGIWDKSAGAGGDVILYATLAGMAGSWVFNVYNLAGTGGGGTPIVCATGALISLGTFTKLELKGVLSSLDSFNDLVADGSWKLTVDDVFVLGGETNVKVGRAGNVPNTWSAVQFGPMGDGDDITIADDPPPPPLRLVEVSTTTGTVVKTYSLGGFSPIFDAAVNSDGTRLIYVDESQRYLKVWNLVTDATGGNIYDHGASGAIWWPTWLGDCSILVSEGGYLQDGNILRLSQTGELLHTYTYDFGSTFEEGQYGIAANIRDNILWIVGDWDKGSADEQPAALIFNLSPGAQLALLPLPGSSTDYDTVCAVTTLITPTSCTPAPPTPTTTAYPVRRLRRFMLPFTGNVYTFLSRLEIYLQAGIGTIAIPSPQVMLRLSRDGGETWGPILTASAGSMGDYAKRVYWNRLGRGRNWVVEVTVSDPVMWSLLEAFADMENGTS